MPYCMLEDLKEKISEEELIQLTDDEETGLIVTSRTDRAISDADAQIDGYCGRRYSVPLDPVPVIIRKFSVDIAIYNLLQRRQGADEDREKDYNNAIKFLENVAKGLVTLGADDPDTPPADAHKTEISGPDRIFSRDKMEGW